MHDSPELGAVAAAIPDSWTATTARLPGMHLQQQQHSREHRTSSSCYNSLIHLHPGTSHGLTTPASLLVGAAVMRIRIRCGVRSLSPHVSTSPGWIGAGRDCDSTCHSCGACSAFVTPGMQAALHQNNRGMEPSGCSALLSCQRLSDPRVSV